jgi:hypothetical protein
MRWVQVITLVLVFEIWMKVQGLHLRSWVIPAISVIGIVYLIISVVRSAGQDSRDRTANG